MYVFSTVLRKPNRSALSKLRSWWPNLTFLICKEDYRSVVFFIKHRYESFPSHNAHFLTSPKRSLITCSFLMGLGVKLSCRVFTFSHSITKMKRHFGLIK